MTSNALNLPALTMDHLRERMTRRLESIGDEEQRELERRGMTMWLEDIAETAGRDEIHSDLIYTLPKPHVRSAKPGRKHGSGARIDPRSLEVAVLIARGPAVALGVPLEPGEMYGELFRVRCKDLLLSNGQRVNTAATVRAVLAQMEITIPDDIGPMLDEWDQDDDRA